MSSIPILAGRIAKKKRHFADPRRYKPCNGPYSSTIFHLAILLRLAILRPNPPGFEVGFKPSSCRQSVEHCHDKDPRPSWSIWSFGCTQWRETTHPLHQNQEHRLDAPWSGVRWCQVPTPLCRKGRCSEERSRRIQYVWDSWKAIHNLIFFLVKRPFTFLVITALIVWSHL